MKKKRRGKLLSFLLTLAMVIGLMPGMSLTAYAEVSDVATPLTLEAKTAGTIVVKNPKLGMKYSVDGGEKTTVNSTDDLTINVTAGQKVSFYGDGTNISVYGDSSSTSIAGGTAKCCIYGNVMSLVDEDGFANAETLTKENTFKQLFKGNTELLTHESRQLVLPATALAGSCYYNMFYGCTGLTTAPELPATTLAGRCYSNMFYGCTGLTKAPELPAITLENSCYESMFQGCTSLAAAPALPATTLASRCYSNMFYGCKVLTTAPELPATTLAGSCYSNMFQGCTDLTTAPELPATTLASKPPCRICLAPP